MYRDDHLVPCVRNMVAVGTMPAAVRDTDPAVPFGLVSVLTFQTTKFWFTHLFCFLSMPIKAK